MVTKIILNSIIAFVSLFFIAKMLGKKQIAELTFTDYVIGISLGSISAEWAIDYENPWYVYCIAIVIFLVFSLLIDYLERKNPFLKKLLKGSPIILISEGQIDYINLKRSKLDINSLLGMCRIAGYFDIDQIEYAVFETSGELSIQPKDNNGQKGLITPLIIDGNIYEKALKTVNKDMQWLKDQLNNTDIKRVLLATYNPDTQKLDIKYKNTKPYNKTIK